MKNTISLMLVLTLAVFMMACGGGDSSADKPAGEAAKPTMSTAGYTAGTVTGGGSISGTVSFAGVAPARKKLVVTKDMNVCGKIDHMSQDLVVSDNNGMANVVVSITNINAGKGMDALGTAFEIDQKSCEFRPHVSIIPAGTNYTILNSDGILHNIHTQSEKNKPINKAQPGVRKRMIVKFAEAEVVRVACDVHNWMAGYIVVVDHPYHAKTDESGKFDLSDVPAGTYTLEYWQESLGKMTQEVTVAAGAVADGSIEYGGGS